MPYYKSKQKHKNTETPSESIRNQCKTGKIEQVRKRCCMQFIRTNNRNYQKNKIRHS